MSNLLLAFSKPLEFIEQVNSKFQNWHSPTITLGGSNLRIFFNDIVINNF